MTTLRRDIAGFLATVLLSVVALPAWSQTWTGATGNNWSTATNWVGGVAPASANTTSVVFNTPAVSYTPFADAPWLLNRLDVLGATPYALSGSSLAFDGAAPSITVVGPGHTIANPLGVPSTLVLTHTADLLISGSISGGGSLAKFGTARLTLTGAALPGSLLTIGSGTLALGDGVTGPSNAPAIVNDGVLETDAPVGILVNGSMTGTGSLTVLGGVLGSFGGSTFTHAGPTTVNSGGQLDTALVNNALLTLDAGGIMNTVGSTVGSLAGGGNLSINGAGSTFVVGGDNTSTTFSGGIFGGGALTKVGTGRLALAVATMPGGTVTISGGTLALGNGGPMSGINNIVNNGVLEANAMGLPVNGSFTGTGSLMVLGGVVSQLGPPFTYTGTTTINAGGQLDGSINNNALLTVNGLMNTAGSTVGSLAGGGNLSINAGTFTFGGDNTSTTFSGGIFGAALTKVGTGTFTMAGPTMPGGTITIASGVLRLGDGATGPGSVPGPIVVNGALEANRPGGVMINGALTGSGTVTVLGGLLAQFLGPPFAHTGTTTVNAGAQFDGSINNNALLTVNGLMNTAGSTVGSLAGAGQLSINGGTLTAGGDNSSTTFSGGIASTGNLVKTGTGRLTLAGASTYVGGTTINAGTLAVTGSLLGPVTVNAGGTFGGTGTVNGSVTVNAGATLSPGLSPGLLNTGNLVLAGVLLEEIEGTILGAQYDSVNVTGTVDLTGATLTLAGALVPGSGNSFTIISNDGADPVTGTFAGLAEGASIAFNGRTLQISYIGGTGNDVVLTVSPLPGVPVLPIPTLSQWSLLILAALLLLVGGIAMRRVERR